jgi:glutamate racemase
MKIGIFDSGLGGLIITHSLISALPEYDYLYLGDTARVPYGNRSPEMIYRFTVAAVDFLFKKNCRLVILACNTASAEALRKIQREYLPAHYPERRVLGVIIPTAEEVVKQTKNKKVALIATAGTVRSGTFTAEIKKLDPEVEVRAVATPLLVPLIENGGIKWLAPIIEEYLSFLKDFAADTLVLGCTHYPIIKNLIKQNLPRPLEIISQDEIIPAKLKEYLVRHPETEKFLEKNKKREFLVTDRPENLSELAAALFGSMIDFQTIILEEK